jgi:Cu-Zn family superoxide dismutase
MIKQVAIWAICCTPILWTACSSTGQRSRSVDSSAVPDSRRAAVADAGRIELKNKEGKRVGSATISLHTEGVRISGNVSGLSSGVHGIHLHQTGKCDPPDFESAGPHFNPNGHQHGDLNPFGPHAGDLGNLMVTDSGEGRFEVIAQKVTLDDSERSLFHPGGTSLIIHAKEDDRRTDPSGSSGPRLVCGVITR